MKPISTSRNRHDGRFVLAVLVSMSMGGPALAELEKRVDDKFDEAMLAYEHNHWPEAYAGFAVLADQGHTEASRIALQMWRYGPSLYGLPFAASDGQVKRWSRLCACPANGPSVAASPTHLPSAMAR